jgi:hypothetical protein
VWTRLNRIEGPLDVLVADSVRRDEFVSAVAELRAELRGEMASVRSDLTQIALAVGARTPRASEG